MAKKRTDKKVYRAGDDDRLHAYFVTYPNFPTVKELIKHCDTWETKDEFLQVRARMPEQLVTVTDDKIKTILHLMAPVLTSDIFPYKIGVYIIGSKRYYVTAHWSEDPQELISNAVLIETTE